ncbi:MAG: polysaccharide biosynthesis/export family protein, partial [Hyphomonadaceae bacterium]
MHRLVLLAAITLLGACGSTPRSSPDFPAAEFRNEDGYDQRYLLWPGDTVEISVTTAPELSRTAVVAPDGRIRIPLAGPVTA